MICLGLALCNTRRRDSSWSRRPRSSTLCGSLRFPVSVKLESGDEVVLGEGRFDDTIPLNSPTQSHVSLPSPSWPRVASHRLASSL